MDARAIFHFLDADHKQVGRDPNPLELTKNGGAEWNAASETCDVPDGALKLVLMPSLFKIAAGTLDLAEVNVTPVN